MNYDHLQALIKQDNDGLLEKVAEAAAQRATENIYRQQAEQEGRFEKLSSREAVIRQGLDKVASAHRLRALLESGAVMIKTAEDEALVEEILGDAELTEDELVGLLMEGEDNAERLEGALMELAVQDPELLSEILDEAEGSDISPEEVDELTDALAEQMISEELGDDDAKVAHDRAVWGEWAKVASPLTQELFYGMAVTKARNALTIQQLIGQ